MSLNAGHCLRSSIATSRAREALLTYFHPVRKARIVNPKGCCRAYSNAAQTTDTESSAPGRVKRNGQTSPQNIRQPRRQESYPKPRSSYTTSPAPRPEPLKSPYSNSESLHFLRELFHPHIHPSLPLPEAVVQRILTHASWNRGMEGHNGRFIFLGRRVLSAYLMLFLTSTTSHKPSSSRDQKGKTPESEFDPAIVSERLLDTYILGEYVGSPWKLQQVMRWTPALASEPDIPLERRTSSLSRSSGLYKVRGACVEAVMGGVFHQFGGAIALRIFHTHILPHLCKNGLGLPQYLVPEVQRLKDQMLAYSTVSSEAMMHNQDNQLASQSAANKSHHPSGSDIRAAFQSPAEGDDEVRESVALQSDPQSQVHPHNTTGTVLRVPRRIAMRA